MKHKETSRLLFCSALLLILMFIPLTANAQAGGGGPCDRLSNYIDAFTAGGTPLVVPQFGPISTSASPARPGDLSVITCHVCDTSFQVVCEGYVPDPNAINDALRECCVPAVELFVETLSSAP